MSPVKHTARDFRVSTWTHREVLALMDRAEEKAGPEDVGEQALMRGLDTAFPFFVWGCPGLASGVDQTIGHIMGFRNSPAVVPPSLLHD
jgi:hypothetical protein